MRPGERLRSFIKLHATDNKTFFKSRVEIRFVCIDTGHKSVSKQGLERFEELILYVR